MDIDDDPFADSFDEDLLRAVEQQESQFFGTALPNDQHVASETETSELRAVCLCLIHAQYTDRVFATDGQSELESLRSQLNQVQCRSLLFHGSLCCAKLLIPCTCIERTSDIRAANSVRAAKGKH